MGKSDTKKKRNFSKQYTAKPSKLNILRKNKFPSLSKIEQKKGGLEEEETANIDRLN